MVTLRECLDASISDALKARTITKTRHGALIKAAQMCADIIDISDDPNASMMSTMLKYITTLGLAPDVQKAVPARKEGKSADMDGMRAKFHAVS